MKCFYVHIDIHTVVYAILYNTDFKIATYERAPVSLEQ